MQENTVLDLIEEVKELSGQTNASNAKILRNLNRGTDRLSAIRLEIARKSGWDSRNQTDINRVTSTTTDTTLLLENELLTVLELELQNSDGTYTKLVPLDRRDGLYETIKDNIGTPTHFDMDGRIIRPFPAPNSEQTYRLTYGRAHPRFSEDNLSQGTGVMPTEEEFIVFYAADRIMIGMSDSARVQVRNELTIMEANIKKMAANVDQATAKRLRPQSRAASTRFGRENNGGFNNIYR
jgi:hypothetical protein